MAENSQKIWLTYPFSPDLLLRHSLELANLLGLKNPPAATSVSRASAFDPERTCNWSGSCLIRILLRVRSSAGDVTFISREHRRLGRMIALGGPDRGYVAALTKVLGE